MSKPQLETGKECNGKLFLCNNIVLIVLRILAGIGVITLLIMGFCANRSYMPKFALGLAIVGIIVPELTIELLVRDFCDCGIFSILRWIRLALVPFIYGAGYLVSPYLFHSAFKLFAGRGRTLGGNTTSLQHGLWCVFTNPPPVSCYWELLVPVTIGLLMTSFALGYLITSKSWRRSIVGTALFVLLEVAAALAASNSPG